MEVHTTREMSTLVVRTSAPVGKLPQVMGLALGEIVQVAGVLGAQLAGPPSTVYHSMAMRRGLVPISCPASAVGTFPGDARA